MWTMVCALGLWIVGLGLAFVLGYLAAGRRAADGRRTPAQADGKRPPAVRRKPMPQASAENDDPLTAEKLRRLQREIDNFMHYDGTPQEKG